VLDAFGSGAGLVFGLLATLRAGSCWRKMAAVDADDETEMFELMRLS
jgi:hypothetical protein